MGLKEKIVESDEVMTAVGLFMKTATIGSIIIGTILILNKVVGFSFDISVSLGL